MAFTLSTVSAAQALDARVVKQLNALAPDERREQRCGIEAMERIRKDGRGKFRPDKVISYTFSEPVDADNAVRAPGAVFRSRGNWYRLNFQCVTGEQGLKVRSFKYRIGSKIPRSRWEELYLYD